MPAPASQALDPRFTVNLQTRRFAPAGFRCAAPHKRVGCVELACPKSFSFHRAISPWSFTKGSFDRHGRAHILVIGDFWREVSCCSRGGFNMLAHDTCTFAPQAEHVAFPPARNAATCCLRRSRRARERAPRPQSLGLRVVRHTFRKSFTFAGMAVEDAIA